MVAKLFVLESSTLLWYLVKHWGQLYVKSALSVLEYLSVRSQNILCWKLSRDCHFGSNGPICIFNFVIFVHRFFFDFFKFYFLFILFSDWQKWATILYICNCFYVDCVIQETFVITSGVLNYIQDLGDLPYSYTRMF